jgi:hypothetical protein
MTVTLELKPEIEARVREQAAVQGISVEGYIQKVIESIVAAPSPTTSEERRRMFEEWIKSHSYIEAPPLSDEAISRESIYGEREDRQL